MSNLLSLLTLGSNAITAHNAGVGIAANNVANVDTEGYTRERVDLRTQPGTPDVGGVRALSPDRLGSAMLAGRIRNAAGSSGMSRAFHRALLDVENRLSGEGATIDEALGSWLGKVSELSGSPTDVQLRASFVDAARGLAASIRQRAAAVEQARRDCDLRIRESTTSVTDLARQLADANMAVQTTGDLAAHDRRDELARQIADQVGGSARIDADGQMRFTLDGGAVLVDGTHAAALETTPDPVTGRGRVAVVDGNARRDVTGEISGGAVGGELGFRDGAGATAATALDQLAFDLATGVNTIHRANAGLDGVTGRDLFIPPAAVAGAAAALEVDPAILADPTRIATAGPGTGPGDASGAVALASLRTALVAGGGARTLGDAALDVVADLAYATSSAGNDASRDGLIGFHLDGLRDSISGVDLDEELADLSRFEHTTAALTRFVSTVDDMLADLISRL